MAHDVHKELARLGAALSPALLRAPEGNGCAERLIRTLWGNLLRVRTFPDVEVLRHALIDLRRTYDDPWLIERHGYRSPARFRRDPRDARPLAA